MSDMKILSALMLLVAGIAGGCTTTDSGPARSLAVTTTPPEPAEFVRQSRPAGAPDFIPVGVTPPPRNAPGRDAGALQKLESDLNAQRDRSRSFARRAVPRSSYDGQIPPRPPKNPPEPPSE